MTKMIRHSMTILGAAAAVACVLAAPAWAQTSPDKPVPPAKLPARVDVVISRYQGEKKVSSQPYTIVLTTNGNPSLLRLNVATPVGVSTTVSKDGDKTTSVQYRDIGTNIDCRVSPAIPTMSNPASDTFDVTIGVSDSSLFNPDGDTKVPASAMAVMSFSSNNNMLNMRSGQTMTLTTATNKVTGGVIKVEVTFTLIK